MGEKREQEKSQRRELKKGLVGNRNKNIRKKM